MQNAAKRNLVLTTVSSFNMLGGTYQTVETEKLYQHVTSVLIKGAYKKHFGDIGNTLTAMADHALALRQADVAERISEILMSVPLPREYHSIGQYYRALSVKRRIGVSAVNSILERVVSSPSTPIRYKARALQAIGGNYFDSGNTEEALRFFLEAGYTASPKYGRDMLTATLSQWMIGVVKSISGDNQGALEGLRKLSSHVQMLAVDQPYIYYSYANSLAVELGEVGHIEEARSFSDRALASPFVMAHPEWRDTAQTIAEKARHTSHSVVALSRKEMSDKDNWDYKDHKEEETSHEQIAAITNEQASDLGNNLLVFRKRAFKSTEAPLYSHLEVKQNQLTLAQKRSRVMDITCNLNENALDRLLAFASELDDRPAQPRRPREINLEERGTLEMMISLWTTGDLRLEDHVAVLSALRDCPDNLRRKNIINSMISYMFRFTQERMESEHFWRKRFEAQLTPEED